MSAHDEAEKRIASWLRSHTSNGVGVFEVAHNMGTSVQIIQEYYGKQATRLCLQQGWGTTDLPDLKAKPLFSTLDMKQKASRYLQRLQSVYSEIMVIKEDYYRNRFLLPPQPSGGGAPVKPAPDEYFYWYSHWIRSEDVSALQFEVLDQIKLMTTIVRDLDDPRCGSSNGSASDCESIFPKKSADGVNCSDPASDPTCEKLIDRIKGAKGFDD